MATTLSEAYRDHPLHLHHIIPLDFSSFRTLPDSHAWPQSKDDNDHLTSNGSCIPIIDLNDPNAMEQIGLACEKWGAFQLKNHGVPLNLIEEVEEEAKKLFSLPSKEKIKALRSAGGATGYGRARISPFFPKYMWHEGFTIMGSPSNDVKKIWPNDYEYFCDIMEDYQKQMKTLAEKITNIIFNILGISKEQNKWVGSNNHCEALQLNFYPCCPDPKKAMGLAPHTDTSLFTILHQSQTSGLQIFKEGVGYVTVDPHPNTLVVNTGDILHILSNSRFRCSLHRAVVNDVKDRYSVAYFYGPPVDYLVSPLVVDGSLPRFRSLSVKDYIGIKAKNLGGALSLISTLLDHDD
ncbi:gibberellin 3-beta-dioxygenase 1-like [Lathyrus oleraceus]|uniref:gibberellin 3beta-dioxygenase n=1 Tax=Pisum sativum TaxID=3888 RepID=B2BA73_PEA|nr:gibberellin 3-beta-dioxygenase 1-like [Pisum sativum]ABI64150.1 gibberellin 3-oxidase [Pisum sativum]KAI5393874.1 hypothetical protein KIW84_060829 [Pisum sativum]